MCGVGEVDKGPGLGWGVMTQKTVFFSGGPGGSAFFIILKKKKKKKKIKYRDMTPTPWTPWTRWVLRYSLLKMSTLGGYKYPHWQQGLYTPGGILYTYKLTNWVLCILIRKNIQKLQKLAVCGGPPPGVSDGTLNGVSLKNNAPSYPMGYRAYPTGYSTRLVAYPTGYSRHRGAYPTGYSMPETNMAWILLA